MTVNVTRDAINVREKLAELDKPTGIAGEAMLRAETPQEQQALIGVGRRNFIINGAMNVSQRGDYTSATSTVDGTYRVDRWQAETFGPTINFQHITTNQPSGFPNSKSIKVITTSTGSGNLGHQQKVEDYKLFSYQTFTISAWVKTNRSDVRLSYYDGSTTYGKKTAVGNDEWQYMSETFVNNRTSSQFVLFIKATAADGSYVSFSTGDYVEITGVQLELGKVATPFEHRSYGEELALCQRYFFKMDFPQTSLIGSGWRHTTATVRCTITAPVNMRTTPSINSSGQPTWGIAWTDAGSNYTQTITSGTAWSIVGSSLDNNRITIAAEGISGLSSVMGGLFGYSGDFDFDAEL